MNKRRFRNISLLVVAVLTILCGVQALSLRSMYLDRREEFARQVTQSMTRAAYDDLLLGNKPASHSSQITFSSSGDIDSIKVDMIKEVSIRNMSGAGKMISFTPKADTLHHDISISDGETTRYIRQEIRIPSVYVLRLNMARFDSLLTQNLLAAGIDLPHLVDVVRGQGDSTASGKILATEPQADPEVVLSTLNDSVRLADPLTFMTSLTTDEELLFRLRIENPDRRLLRDMSGVIVSSLLMLVAVAWVLIYLLRTLFRQKSLEEMRLDLTHNITHELKTPIAVANAANDALLDFRAAEDAGRRNRYLTVIREQLAALSGMVERILTMSIEEREDFTIRRETVDIGVLFDATAAKFRLKSKGRAEITVNVAPAGLTVKADRFHLSHVLDNLMDNALKYSGEQVYVELSARRTGHGVSLSVSDDGIGIERSAQAHIFEKFYRVPTGDRHDVKGFGLGLYYVHLIAARHGGTVSVESEPGRGTTFTITIPER